MTKSGDDLCGRSGVRPWRCAAVQRPQRAKLDGDSKQRPDSPSRCPKSPCVTHANWNYRMNVHIINAQQDTVPSSAVPHASRAAAAPPLPTRHDFSSSVRAPLPLQCGARQSRVGQPTTQTRATLRTYPRLHNVYGIAHIVNASSLTHI